MKVHLLSAYNEPTPDFGPNWLRHHVPNTTPHVLVDSPEDADLILFVETFASLDPYFFDVIRHPVFKSHPAKCVLYHNSDSSITLCRTISPSVEKKQHNLNCRRSFHYIARRRENERLEAIFQPQPTRRYLFSFQGSVETHAIRKEIMNLRHPECKLADPEILKPEDLSAEERAKYQEDYIQTILESHFVLCPRGFGPTSMRLFEVMQLGRTPIVIGDSWEPVADIDWESCSIFIKEEDIASIPQILEQNVHRSAELGTQARRVWQEKFAPDRAFDELVRVGTLLINEPYNLPQLASDLMPLGSPSHWRKLLGYFRRQLHC